MKNHAQIKFLNGVGVSLEKFHPVSKEEKNALREKFRYSPDDFIILYIAEFIPRKDHAFFIKNIPLLKAEIPNLKIIMPGRGEELKQMKILSVNLEVDDIIYFPGYTKDISTFCAISDLYAATSRQEGLPVSVIEAMACGLPVVAGNIRGHKDAVRPERNGELYETGNSRDFVEKIMLLYRNPDLRAQIQENNVKDAAKYSVEIAVEKMAQIYSELIFIHKIQENIP